MNLPGQGTPISPEVIVILSIWSLIWKGFALWRAAKLDQKNWFIAILILSTVGILEIVYLFAFAKKKVTLEDLNPRKYFPKATYKREK